MSFGNREVLWLLPMLPPALVVFLWWSWRKREVVKPPAGWKGGESGAMDSTKTGSLQSLNANVGRLSLRKKTLLLPQMSPVGSHLFTATFRAFGLEARVLDTYKGLDLGLQYTSGKECYPCQVTMGDILHHLKGEQERLGPAFSIGKNFKAKG